MDTLDFLRRILPARGLKILATPRPAPYKGFKHHIANTAQELADLANELDASGNTVYHACASFAEMSVTVMKRNKTTGEMEPKQAVRVADNAAFCRSFWVDLDVDADDPNKYQTQRDAIAGLLAGCTKARLPVPMLVSSGYGVHAYWPLAADIPAAAWVKIAVRLKALLHHVGVKQDPTRTADVASVLRPVGMTNRKRADNLKEVKLLRDAPDVEAATLLQSVLTAMKMLDVKVNEPRSLVAAFAGNSDLVAKIEYPPSSAVKIAEKCQALAHVRDMMGNVEEPFWRAAMGVIKHTVEGDALAHEWSQGHPAYDKYETQEKLDRWQAGPATCASFECYGKCDGCPVRGKVKSPIQLGVQLPQSDRVAESIPQPAPMVERVEEAPRNEDGKLLLPELPESMRQDFAYRKGVLVRRIPGDDATPDRMVMVCQEYIVPYEVIRPHGDAKQGNKAIIKAWRYTLSNTREEVTLPFTAVASGGKDMVTVFGDIGMVVEAIGMHKYMTSWLANLKRDSADAMSAEHMGWTGDNFVLGRTLYTPEGPKKAALASNLQGYQQAFTKQGDVAEWTRLVNAAYNRPGQEQYQFMVAAGFGAPLMRFTGYHGVIVAAVSYSSGQGKSTAQDTAVSIFGDPRKLRTAFGRQTQNALYERLGAMGSLPFEIDEVSNVEGAVLADMAYAISEGVQKDRLNKSGELRAQRDPWETLVLTSGNRSIISALASEDVQREPEMRRVFEVAFEPVSDLTKSQADEIFTELRLHYGVAGEVYVDYLARNQETVVAAMKAMTAKLNDALNLQRNERFWGAALVSTLTGLAIANKLGLVGFGVKGMMPWVRHALEELRSAVSVTARSPDDLVGALMSDVTFDLWVTATTGNRATKPAHVMREPRRGAVAGRLIVDLDLLQLRPEYVRQWCDKRRADYRQLRNTLIDSGCFVDTRSMSKDLLTGISGVNPMKGKLWELRASSLGTLGELVRSEPAGLSDNVVSLRPADVS